MKRRTIAILTAAACLTLGACSDSPDNEPSAKTTETVTATVTPAASPSLSQAEIMRQCSIAVSEAAPGWEDWSYSPGGWQDDPQTPEVCLGLVDEVNPPRGNRAYGEAFREGLEMADDPRARQ
ncbi:hypothetical protein [Streptomyces sp. ME01-18h]|uniref:hypothetical protein n=1 Tax=Streptomyces sp. ME01-18h TaxID=462920 RepID=UPI0029BA8E6F|nr:hypothetical protein [Streptomyces sp. ME01-18h]MDX3398433.1 hypothetical protein [Streptomyces sp. ME01-18h]